MKNIILGILGLGGLAGIAFLWTSWINKKSDIGEAIHKITQKIKKDKVEKDQVVIVKRIEDNENLSEKTKKEIIKIKEKANVEIKEILKKDNFKGLTNKVDELW